MADQGRAGEGVSVTAGSTHDEWAATQTEAHEWWDPGDEYPRLRVWTDDGVLLSCRKCGAVKRKDGRPDSACPGVVKVALR